LLAAVIAVGLIVAAISGWNYYQNHRHSAWPQLDRPLCQATLADGRTASLDIEQAGNASLIAGVATARGLAPRATSIALATTFQESGLRNLDYGDRDSLGLFQQRPSAGWGTPEQIMDPYYATGKFFDAMVRVPNWDSTDIGQVAQAVQRSAFPEAYDQHVERARILASALTGETPAAWTCHLRQPGAPDPDGLVAALNQTYGALVFVTAPPVTPGPASVGAAASSSPAPAQLYLEAQTPAVAWSAAAFAQSWAARYGLSQVQVGDWSWTGHSDVLAGWVGQPLEQEPLSLRISFSG
jgi:hypothetical protein